MTKATSLAPRNLTADQRHYLKAKDAYSTGAEIMSDAEFDALEDALKERFPNWPPLYETRVVKRLSGKYNVAYDVPAPSLNKVYTDAANLVSKVQRLLTDDDSAIVLPKYDGSCLQITYSGGVPVRAVVGGDALVGKCIDHLLPYLNIPRSINTMDRVVLRCEAIIPIALHSALSGPARAIVAGVLNRKQPDVDLLKMVHIVVLRVFSNTPRTLSAGFRWAQSRGFRVAQTLHVINEPEEVSTQLLSLMLNDARDNVGYEIDGIVVAANAAASDENPTESNPKLMFAVKENSAERFDAKVIGIVWQTSRRGYLTPKVEIEPIKFASGHVVRYATLHNAKWAQDRRIGVGAVVTIVRSGEVIPKIIAVPKPSKFVLPAEDDFGAWEWVGPDIKLCGMTDAARVRETTFLLDLIGMKRVGDAAASTFFTANPDAAPYDLIRALLRSEQYALKALKACGFSLQVARTLLPLLPKSLSPAQVILLSQVFGEGFGLRRASKMATLIEDNLGMVTLKKMQDALGEVFGKKAHAALPEFMAWFEHEQHILNRYLLAHEEAAAAEADSVPSTQLLKGHIVSFTGYRDAAHEAWVVDNAGTVKDFSAKTSILIYKEGGKRSSKIDKAAASGKVLVTTFEALQQGKHVIPACTRKN